MNIINITYRGVSVFFFNIQTQLFFSQRFSLFENELRLVKDGMVFSKMATG